MRRGCSSSVQGPDGESQSRCAAGPGRQKHGNTAPTLGLTIQLATGHENDCWTLFFQFQRDRLRGRQPIRTARTVLFLGMFECNNMQLLHLGVHASQRDHAAFEQGDRRGPRLKHGRPGPIDDAQQGAIAGRKFVRVTLVARTTPSGHTAGSCLSSPHGTLGRSELGHLSVTRHPPRLDPASSPL